MKRFFADRVVELCGIVSSLLTIAIILLIEKWFEFSLFTLTFWVIVPMGAFLTGLAAASGYYVGAILVNEKPSRMLLVNMVLIAGATFFGIYYLQYRSLVIEGQQVSQVLDFPTYLRIVLTKAEYGLARAPNASFEVGPFGYVIAAIQLAAFLVGGFAMYLGLTSKPFCESCNKYLKRAVFLRRTFEDPASFEPFATRLNSLSPPSAEYLHILKEPHSVAKVTEGSVALDWALFSCPACSSELIVETPQVYKNNNWSEVTKLERRFPIDRGRSVKSEFELAKSM